MATLDTARDAPASLQVLPGFEPVQALWDGEAAFFPSEHSARWAIRQQRLALIEAGAIALHMGRTFVHRERLVQVMRKQAIDAYKQRFAAASCE